MPRYFTHYWVYEKNKQNEGEPCDDSWSNLFRQRGVDIGDVVYILTTIHRELYLVGRMTVGDILDNPRAIRQRYGRDYRWEQEVIVASDCTTTFKRKIPDAIARSLLFKTTSGVRGFKYAPDGRLDQQTARNIKELTVNSAHVLDHLLDQSALRAQRTPTSVLLTEEITASTGAPEGAKQQVVVNRYERDRRNRQACLDHHGYTCSICEFDFEKTYGPDGKGIIHVHHLTPLSKIGKTYRVDPVNDLIPVCPNCHAVIHSVDPAWTPQNVKAMRNRARKKKLPLRTRGRSSGSGQTP